MAATVALCVSAALLLPIGTGASAASSPRADEPVPWDWTPVDVPPVTVENPVVPIFAALGKDKPVAGAKVEIRSGGQVIATGTTGEGGVALIPEAGLPDAFGVKISGGIVDGNASKVVLLSKFDPARGSADADLVTTLIERFKTKTGTSDWSANSMVNYSLGLINDVDTMTSRFSTDQRFDANKFIAAANKRGGVDKYMNWLIPQINKGKKFNFRGTVQQRSTSSDLLSYATGDLGSYLGLPSPGADIQKKAQDAAKSMQKAFTDMLGMEWKTQILVNQSTYTTETVKISAYEQGMSYMRDYWSKFTQSDVKSPGYESLRKQMYADIHAKVSVNYDELESLFPLSSQGVLRAGHAVFQSMYGYYLPGDVTQIQGMVGYWQSLAAAGNLFIVNMMSYDPALVINMANQNSFAQATDARILKAMPASLTGPELGIWKLDRAYKMNSYDFVDYKLITDMANYRASCDNWEGGYSNTGSPKYISRSDLNARYSKMVPSDYTWASVSDSQYFSALRTNGKSVLDVIHSQDKGINFLVYNDTNTILGQSHSYTSSSNGKTQHEWKGEIACNHTDVSNGGTTINNSPTSENGGFVVSAMVFRSNQLTAPNSF